MLRSKQYALFSGSHICSVRSPRVDRIFSGPEISVSATKNFYLIRVVPTIRLRVHLPTPPPEVDSWSVDQLDY
jgi:hypothetical protein